MCWQGLKTAALLPNHQRKMVTPEPEIILLHFCIVGGSGDKYQQLLIWNLFCYMSFVELNVPTVGDLVASSDEIA